MTPTGAFHSSPTGSSGDLAADRRYQWAVGAFEARDFEAARDLFMQAIELAPHWAPGRFGLGEALEALGRREDAIAAYREALARDPADACGAALRLARLGDQRPVAAPRAYVQTLFDQYAANFDRHLVETLAYRGPQILRDAIERAAPGRIFANMLDLGCGAGHAGETFRARVGNMAGVDLSPAMIGQCRGRRLYDRLAVADLLDFLAAEPGESADLAVAADVFVYIGDLDRVFAAVARVLIPGGLFAFTAQNAAGGATFGVGADMRFAHSQAYLRDCAGRTGFAILELAPAAVRKERGEDVPGWAVVLRKN
ncbi:methyltransferase domain-containing protein [Rhodoblastus acidophilus]|uniref:Methyltransferase domain-containing protein n=1 Tax=Candidatus Rhodoblastus alkanivorans TaxID=2954117 RepID=A0ABS9ZAI2_9HYPH|nr:methyltransferase domain-containing protein [Candidatus Rhodoblastus alkanivorans]MCI4677230.1 methyltransferase domain-containing protein [Candidatus Rhodoblastus alkanivorans]MCI4684582.1 methyltransferase domain-containing protein [Candidatus Rhodoblastus alkanivorans]MDI4641904.1 methyltransferase domain-containing protein [Rhodoblastus acidophilus]